MLGKKRSENTYVGIDHDACFCVFKGGVDQESLVMKATKGGLLPVTGGDHIGAFFEGRGIIRKYDQNRVWSEPF